MRVAVLLFENKGARAAGVSFQKPHMLTVFYGTAVCT